MSKPGRENKNKEFLRKIERKLLNLAQYTFGSYPKPSFARHLFCAIQLQKAVKNEHFFIFYFLFFFFVYVILNYKT